MQVNNEDLIKSSGRVLDATPFYTPEKSSSAGSKGRRSFLAADGGEHSSTDGVMEKVVLQLTFGKVHYTSEIFQLLHSGDLYLWLQHVSIIEGCCPEYCDLVP